MSNAGFIDFGQRAIVDMLNAYKTGATTEQVFQRVLKMSPDAFDAKFDAYIKERFGKVVRVEGLTAADWVLIDADDVIVHIFRPEVRNFYNLERMWAFGDDSGVSAAARG